MLAPGEAQAIVPELDARAVRRRLLQPDRRHPVPVAVPVGLRARGGAHGVAIYTYTPVDGIERRGAAAASASTTPAGTFAAGGSSTPPAPGRRSSRGWSASTLPNHPQRHEILSTEPLKPFLRPMVTVLETGLYCRSRCAARWSAASRCPAEDDARRGAPRLAAGVRDHIARALVRADAAPRRHQGPAPVGRALRRQPDGNPILGERPTCPASTSCCGFVGHGFMMAPVVARHFAAYLIRRHAARIPVRLAPRSLHRRRPHPARGGEEMFIG